MVDLTLLLNLHRHCRCACSEVYALGMLHGSFAV